MTWKIQIESNKCYYYDSILYWCTYFDEQDEDKHECTAATCPLRVEKEER